MKIAVLLDNPFINDRRVFREITALAQAGYAVTLFGVRHENLPDIEEGNQYAVNRIFGKDIFNIREQKSLNQYLPAILQINPAIIHCHDQSMLQLGVLLKKKNPDLILIYDSHELFHAWPLNLSKFGDPWLFVKSWMVRKYQVIRERRNSKYIDYLITVNHSLAVDLKRWFRFKKEVVVLRNIPEKQEFNFDKNLIRKYFSLPENVRILVFIGSAIYLKTLNLEQVIAETAAVENLAFIIICGEQGGKNDVMQWVKENAYHHVYFHPLLKPQEIGPCLASCDVGLVPTWNKKDLSYWYALDNKLFEYMMSGIPVLATQQPEYKAVVEEFGLGVCVNPDHPGAYKEGLIKILSKIDSYKKPLEEARCRLNWDMEKQYLIKLYSQIQQS